MKSPQGAIDGAVEIAEALSKQGAGRDVEVAVLCLMVVIVKQLEALDVRLEALDDKATEIATEARIIRTARA